MDDLSPAPPPPAPAVNKKRKLTSGSEEKVAENRVSKRTEISKALWYDVCVLKHSSEAYRKMAFSKFLRSEASGPHFSGTKSEAASFARYYAQYLRGELDPGAKKRRRESRFGAVEAKLGEYVRLRQKLYHGGAGIHWTYLQKKLLEWAALEGSKAYEKFVPTPGFIHKALRDFNLTDAVFPSGSEHEDSVHQGEEYAAKRQDAIIAEWKEKLHDAIKHLSVDKSRIYSVSHTSLFHNKLPNISFLLEETGKHKRKRPFIDDFEENDQDDDDDDDVISNPLLDDDVLKQLKSKDRITLILCTACNGDKLPISVIGKPGVPACFRLCPDRGPPLPYKSQTNAWFDPDVMRWWILQVFWPHFVHKHGDVPCLLLCPSNISKLHLDSPNTSLPSNLHLFPFSHAIPANFPHPHHTYQHQHKQFDPARLGIITALKIGYKSTLLEKLLAIFDVEGGFEQAARQRSRQKRGCKGIDFAGKPHILDAMIILDSIWSNPRGNFASHEWITLCWRKANLLPPKRASITPTACTDDDTGNLMLGNTRRPYTIAPSVTTISAPRSLHLRNANKIQKDQCAYLANLMKVLRNRTIENQLDTYRVAYAMNRSFVEEGKEYVQQHHPYVSRDQNFFRKMAMRWIDIESDAAVTEYIIYRATKAYRKSSLLPHTFNKQLKCYGGDDSDDNNAYGHLSELEENNDEDNEHDVDPMHEELEDEDDDMSAEPLVGFREAEEYCMHLKRYSASLGVDDLFRARLDAMAWELRQFRTSSVQASSSTLQLHPSQQAHHQYHDDQHNEVFDFQEKINHVHEKREETRLV